MNTLEESELSAIGGGLAWIPLMGAYITLLDKVEKNPGDYTWTMDWYYR